MKFANSISVPVSTTSSEVAFVEAPVPLGNPISSNDDGFCPDITINIGSVIIGVSKTASEALLNRLFEVVIYAR